ncbi:MAG: hypothetical protein AMXMBFR13_44560 [Phycisphaerae bacterium]
MDQAIRPSRGRAGIMLIVGVLLGLPVGWLLASLAILPFQLGLFFFLLLGLLIGAFMYRAGRPAAPMARPLLWTTGMAVALAIWLTSLLVEYNNAITRDAPKAVRDSMRRTSLTTEQVQELRQGTTQAFSATLKENYAPGGFVGYVRWAATSGEVQLPKVVRSSTTTYQLKQRPISWIIRVVLSLLFMSGAILSQVLGLSQVSPVPDPATEDQNRPAPPVS